MQKLAIQANFSNWKQAQHVIKEVVEAIHSFNVTAKLLGVTPETIRLISKQLDNVYQENKILLA